MKNNSGIILVLAYPETIVSVADEWYSPYLRFVGVGKKNYVRAGHAALVLINKQTGILEYHDFGRYITSIPNGRVRGSDTDHELHFPIKAEMIEGKMENLDSILKFLATQPKLTHGDGILMASVCDVVDYDKARDYIDMMQNRDFIRYAAFIKDACNCARFVTDTLIASVTDLKIKDKLTKSKRFTPSTYGNVINADTEDFVYQVSTEGVISEYTSNARKDNLKYFLDRLRDYQPNFVGTLQPKYNDKVAEHAQWLDGIAAGAWFELYEMGSLEIYRFRRISPHGNIDCDTAYRVTDTSFNYNDDYQFVHYSNCKFFHILQNEKRYRFDILDEIN